MKKTLAVLLASVMVLSLAGCTGGNSSSSSSNPSSSNTEVKTKLERGVWNADQTEFTSTQLGIKVPMPTGWVASTTEEINEMMQLGASALTEEQQKYVDVNEVANLYEFVISAEDGSSLMLMGENLKLTVGAANLTEKDYAKSLETQLKAVTSIDYVVGGVDTYTIGGKEYTRLSATLAQGSATQWYLLRKENGIMYAFICTFATAGQADYETVLTSIVPC